MKNRIKFIILIISVLIITILLVLPTLGKNYIVKNSPTLLGRQVEIEKLHYNYFTNTLSVYAFTMFESNAKDAFVSFDTLKININPWPLIRDKIRVEEFFMSGLTATSILEDTLYNFSDLIEFHSSGGEENQGPEDPIKFNVSNIFFRNMNIYFDNRDVGKITHLEDLAFHIPNVAWDQVEKSNADLKFNFKNGGYFKSILNIHPIEGDFDAHLIIRNLYLSPFYEYLTQFADIHSFNGIFNADIDITGNTNEVVKSIVTGQIQVDSLALTDGENKTFLSIQSIDTRLHKIDYFNKHYAIDSLLINGSFAFFELDSVSNNISRIFRLTSDTTTTVTDTTVAVYAIDHLAITNGVLDYSDNLTGQSFKYHLSDIELLADSIQNTSDWVDLYATMILNNRGTLKASLGIDPEQYLNSTLDISIEKFLLSDLNIYTNYYTGHSIVKGDMFYISSSKITDGQIESENKLLIKNASLESVDGGLYSLPLKFAFFLLTDKNGNVNLDVPVRGDLKDPNINIGKIIWQTFKNVIGKTVAAPVNFLVHLVGGDPEDLEVITFSYRDTTLSEKHYSQLNKLIQLEEKKSGLQIELTYFADENLFRQSIATELIGLQFYETSGLDYEKNNSAFEEYVATRAGSDTLTFTEAIWNISNQEEVDSVLQFRIRNIIETSKAFVLDQADWSKIDIRQSDPIDPENSGSEPKFRISYGVSENDL